MPFSVVRNRDAAARTAYSGNSWYLACSLLQACARAAATCGGAPVALARLFVIIVTTRSPADPIKVLVCMRHAGASAVGH